LDVGEPIVVSGLVKHYGRRTALDGLSFKVESGPAVGLLGPNGAGKTTLMKTLLGLTGYSRGEVRVLGFDVAKAPLESRQKLGYMPENDALFPDRTGLENVVHAGRLSGMPGAAAFSRAHEVLDYLGMDEVRYRPVEEYSVGLKQKVKLGAAVVHGPKLLLLDEPLSGLDPGSRDEMMSLLTGIARSGTTMIVSSHVLPDIEALCSEVLVLDRGKVLYEGAMSELEAGEKGRYRIRVKGDAGLFRRLLLERSLNMESLGPSEMIVDAPTDKELGALWGAAAEANCQIRELEPARYSLEQAFLKLLGSRQGNGGQSG